mgnify:CR=1 FL=1
MRLRSALASFLVAVALAMLPLAGSARPFVDADQALSIQIAVAPPGTDAGPMMAAVDRSEMDDCCLPHRSAGDPCKSAACCSIHCAGLVLPFLQLGLQEHYAAAGLAPIVRDQILGSIESSPPFRPPRD